MKFLDEIKKKYPTEAEMFDTYLKEHPIETGHNLWTMLVGRFTYFFYEHGIECGVLSSEILQAFDELHKKLTQP